MVILNLLPPQTNVNFESSFVSHFYFSTTVMIKCCHATWVIFYTLYQNLILCFLSHVNLAFKVEMSTDISRIPLRKSLYHAWWGHCPF